MSRERNVAAFVRARRAAWERLDALVARVGLEPLSLAEVEELDRLYRRTAGDLAWARSAFPGSDAEGYLAQLTGRAFGVLYRRRRGLAAAAALVRHEIPAAFARSRGAFLLALGLLVAGIAGGALAVAFEPEAATLLVPVGIRDAVAAGRVWTDDLLAVAPGVGGSIIVRNNVTVASLAFAGGLTGGLLTAGLLLGNGLVLGAVGAFAWQGGQGRSFLAFVAAHGPAELLALLLAAQGGLHVAGALVRPGEAPRGALLAARGREASRLLVVVAPLLVLLGVVEASVSPGTGWAPWAKAALGASLAAGTLAWLWRGRTDA
ncbi:MAG TPA: stage II sporulation protein M [Anaeromyxobacteraceae bacterium]|nr:stage II sporulation protein M [Anaeromyxobacteraceae bacterium]